MSRIYTWKGLSMAVALTLGVAVSCILSGSAGMASGLIIVAVLEAIFGALVIAVTRASSKGNHAARFDTHPDL